eukprot:CAMPEP_0116971178 /NCGR_PEP_ID=MMETSP0467-20121206/53012_1 /TAXON_ID=283647 /ORGANISM="Mesodinium pulex, Strain SPMC105" /LENGTH=104 /DNA_ID=CAMNT_0004662269 /DNA_START=663 /DNA_END=977 /DNA_ORIENTATION=-
MKIENKSENLMKINEELKTKNKRFFDVADKASEILRENENMKNDLDRLNAENTRILSELGEVEENYLKLKNDHRQMELQFDNCQNELKQINQINSKNENQNIAN